ncbi:uncharacterized protein LOC106670153 [Cimex lectularius]|uniref:Ig-like domain-containing protein n=1 Tax=Cimex lectularius TaxID=79782 RepID=A0A8I6TJI6_CIMLE|nr:uncharacterized protein LOC106670153 [Cimex lectularius]
MFPKFVLVLFIIFYKSDCLILEGLQVPEEGLLGGLVILECRFRLGHKPLYSVKWYKENEEIFRFMPDTRPNTKSFHIPGLRVDEFKSDMHKLVLVNLTGNATGSYKCEVSTEGPSFETVYEVANLTVLAFPDRDPVVTTDKYIYGLGEYIFANCTSGSSFPATSLKWFLNGIKMDKSCVSEEGVIDIGNGRYRSFSRIKFRSRGDPGRLTLSCVGKITKTTKPTKTRLVLTVERPAKYNLLTDGSGLSESSNPRELSFCFRLLYLLMTIKEICAGVILLETSDGKR